MGVLKEIIKTRIRHCPGYPGWSLADRMGFELWE